MSEEISNFPALVSTEWLHRHLSTEKGRANIRVLDVSWYSNKDGRQDYHHKHIPTSQYWDLMYAVQNNQLFPRNYPQPEAFQEQARMLGINNDTHIVVYDNGVNGKSGFYVGCRAWFMFKTHGHARVSVLDGGFEKWESDGYETIQEIPHYEPGNFTANFHADRLRTFDDVLANITTKEAVLGDSRSVAQYTDKAGGDYFGGYIPGSVNVPLDAFIDKNNKVFISKEEIQTLMDNAGITPHQHMITSCNTGMTACTLVLGAYMCGITDTSVYLGSWTEWKQVADPQYIIKPQQNDNQADTTG